MGNSIRLVFFLLISLAVPAATSDEVASLIAFKLSSVEVDPSNSLRSWNTSGGSSPCSWAGVNCSSDGHVLRLDLSNLGLVGCLRVDDLMALPQLRDIDLRGNFFYGNLSHARGSSSSSSSSSTTTSLCRFETVDLSHNNFSDVIAGQFLASCNHLVSLNLSMNFITGGIYPYVSSLRQLDLSRNRISDDGLLNYSLMYCQNIMYLNFSDNLLTGRIPDAKSCTNLSVLDLSYNPFSREIPASFVSRLPASLNQLILSHGNFSGDLSALDFAFCDGTVMLDFSFNSFSGSGLPSSLVNCRKLEWLDLSNNHLRDTIPSFLGKFSSLKHLSLSNNNFSGEIPTELGGLCSTLDDLDLSMNSLTGGLPSTFTSCSALRSLDLGNNHLSGNFIGTVINTLPSLRYLHLPFNNFSGVIPLESLKNCSLLEVIDLSSNEFTGNIPVGLCSSLPSLQKILLPNNFLSGELPLELAKCTNIRSIDLSFNDLNGAIPPEMFALPKLVDLVMWANNLSGEIPNNLCSRGGSLQMLILNHNAITGSIPETLTGCLDLIWVSLYGNRLTGVIPSGMGKLHRLAILQLGNNSLTGEIPPEIGNCRNLIWLDLNLNRLTGPVPPSLASQAGLIEPGVISGKEFAFLRNEGGTSCPGAGYIFEFAGIKPERLASFPLVHACPTTRIYTGMTVYTFMNNGSMIYLDLSYNLLSGSIPENYGTMNYLQVLNLGHNQLIGEIPRAFVGLTVIGALDLSHNHLTGFLPGELGKLSRLADLDVSNNNLTGRIPTTGQLMTFPASRYENNSGLCGIPLPPCGSPAGILDSNSNSSGKRSMRGGSTFIAIAISMLILGSLILVVYKMKRNQKEEITVGYVDNVLTPGISGWKISGVLEPLSINIATFEKPLRKLTFAHLLEATNGFSADSLIGSGGFGEVYKARLDDGCVVAVKKLIHVTSQGDREFTAEMETIGKIKHRNLVPLLGYCKVGEERLLVYDYMRHGSLDMILHERSSGAVTLDWAARKKIAIGSARGLAFLHHSCIPHIIHRDMKSSNVLLDENFEARVSDFGMARLMNALDTHLSVSTLAGTPGYVPPEYYQSFRCTTKGDVYSYGVVLLELLSGKRPIDPSEFGDNNLVGWVTQMVKDNRSGEVFDPELLGKKSGEAELYQYLKIACECLDDRPPRRPTMIQVMAMFKELQFDTDSDVLDGLPVGSSTIDEQRENVP